MSGLPRLDGFGPLRDRYDGFIIDIWGVLHDGVRPYPGAIECLKALRAAGKRIVLLSNAPRRAAAAAAAMVPMGITADLFDDIVTSGEVTHRMLAERREPFFRSLGRTVYHLGPARDRNLIKGLDLRKVTQVAEASFVLNTGPDDSRDPTDMAPFEPELLAAATRHLPMVCANPDLEVIRGGRRILCAGALALRYAQLDGGPIVWIGKPDPLIYQPVLARLAVPKERILVVGDSLRTDMAGAAAIGVDSCWVLGGLHGQAADPEAEARREGVAAIAMIEAFRL